MVQCPICGKVTLKKNKETHEIPHFGEIVIISTNCSKCGYSDNNIKILEESSPVEYKTTIEGKEDLKTKIVRSSTGIVEINDLGLKLEPGAKAKGFFTSIEGLLNRFEKILDRDWDNESDEKSAREILEKLEKAKEGSISIKIKVSDPRGNSALIGDKVNKKTLEEDNSETKGKKISNEK